LSSTTAESQELVVHNSGTRAFEEKQPHGKRSSYTSLCGVISYQNWSWLKVDIHL